MSLIFIYNEIYKRNKLEGPGEKAVWDGMPLESLNPDLP